MEGPLVFVVFVVLVVFALIGTAIVAVMNTIVFWLVIWAFVGLPVLLVLGPMLFYRRYREKTAEPRKLR
jgi:hypothetical protein